MKLWTRVKRDANPLWEVAAAEPDYFEPTKLIRVKVRKPLGENSRIKVKGNAINSGWERMKMPWFFLNNKRILIRDIPTACRLMVKLKARVRGPALEDQHREDIRKEQKRAMTEAKNK